MPGPGNPQSLNRFAYVNNNPLRYTDPSGHIEIDEAERAQEILNLLGMYGIRIRRDWGWQTEYNELGEPLPLRRWNPGAWQLRELALLREAVEDISANIGGAQRFRELVGPVIIRRVHGKDLLRLICEYISPRVSPAALTTGRIVTLYDEGVNSKTIIVHELGHVWDWGTFASESLDPWIGRGPRPTDYAWTNADEHWAETVVVWVYPEYEAEFRGHAGLSFRHQQYMALAVNGQIPIPWWAEPPILFIPDGSVLP